MTIIETAKFFDDIRITPMWPPGPATNRVMLAILPYGVIPKDTAWLAEAGNPEEWFQYEGFGPALVLGECMIGPNEKYRPKPSYPVSEAIKQTKLYREPQLKDQKKRQAIIERERGKINDQSQKAKHWADSVREQRAELERKERELKSLSPTAQSERIGRLEVEVKNLRTLLEEVKKQAEASMAELKKLTEREYVVHG